MASPGEIEKVCRLLEQDVLKNVVTLKMLDSYGSSMTLRLFQEGDSWALQSLLPSADSDWDRKAYPDARLIGFVDGNSAIRKLEALTTLPKDSLVIKTGDQQVKDFVARLPGVTRTTTYRSFTSPAGSSGNRGEAVIPPASGRDAAAWGLFLRNGYEPDELQRYFDNDARWFGIHDGGQLGSACFVYRNYKTVWEIAGVYTIERCRKRGLGRTVVRSALAHLAQERRVPRYQVRGDNAASIALAQSCGLQEFLQVDHYLLPTGSARQ